jgi:hypothetical protein
MKWYDINKDTPFRDGKYIVHCKSADPEKPFVHMAWYDPCFGWSLLPATWIDAITHWMPLPNPPKDE